MIYQITIYYGAILNGKVVYSLESNLEDCSTLPTNPDEKVLKHMLKQTILDDGLNPDDFEIGYLTKKQYENRFNIENEKVVSYSLKRKMKNNKKI